MLDSLDNELVRDVLAAEIESSRHRGTLQPAHLSGASANADCEAPDGQTGDVLRLTVLVDPAPDGAPDASATVTDVRFEGDGCAITRASGALAARAMIGKRLGDVLAWDHATMQDLLGIPLPPERRACAEVGILAFRDAVKNAERP